MNNSNGFKGSDFLVNKIFDNVSGCNCVTCKNISELI